MYAYITPLHHSNDNNKLLLIGSVHVLCIHTRHRLLCVLAPEFLQCLVNKSKDIDLLNAPIPLQYSSDIPIVQYVDM